MDFDAEVAKEQQPGPTLMDRHRIAQAQALGAQFGWRRTDPSGQQMAHQLFNLGWVTSPVLKQPIRVAQIRHCGYVVKDLAHVERAGRKQWKAFGCSGAAGRIQAMRRKQIAANKKLLNCTLRPKQHEGETAYVIGNGPSAKEARDWIPKRDQRNGKVIAINGASKWFSGDMDYFATWDWLGRPYWYDGIDFSGADGLFSIYAANRVVRGFLDGHGERCHFFKGGNRNPYRKYGRSLPDLEEGLETMFSVIHACFWLGFKNIVLFGAEHAIAPESDDLHSGEGDAPKPDRAVVVDQEHDIVQLFKGDELLYTQVKDYLGRPCWTTPHLHNGAAFLVAQAMWLHDSGVNIVNCSQGGLELIYAPHVGPDLVIARTEGTIAERLGRAPCVA